MDKIKHNEQAHDIILSPQDVEKAVVRFVRELYPEYSEEWLLSSKYSVGAVIIAGTKK